MNKWKEASSLIVSAASKSQIIKRLPSSISKSVEVDKCNFQLLALKKTSVHTQKPQVCVFPGGSVSVADSVREWEGLFLKFGISLNLLSNTLVHGDMSKLPIFNDKKQGDIPRWLSLRITAIRETFEECGLLLCKSKYISQDSKEHDKKDILSTNHFEIDEIDLWRNKVLDDPFQFMSLCVHFNCYPDVEHLCYWSNWLTPNHLRERYDAIFFLTKLASQDKFTGSPDYKEIASVEWLEPEELLMLSNNADILLKPPQWFEINNLKNIRDINLLENHSIKRSNICTRWMPVRIIALDGEITLLPDDMMYPKEVDPFKPYLINKKQDSMESLRCELMHRMEHSGVKIALFDTRNNH